MDEAIFYYVAGVPVLGVAAQWLAWRLKLPSILLLLAFGVVLGQFVHIDALLMEMAESESPRLAAELLFPLVSLAVSVILFEGGLSLRFGELREAGRAVVRLVTLGALVTWGLTAWAAWAILQLDYRLAILLGAILVVTGPTVVAPLIRHVRPKRKIGSIVKWEGIVIDPIGAVLAVLVFEELLLSTTAASHLWGAVWLVTATVATGAVLGVATGSGLVLIIKRFWIPDHLHSVLFLAAALGTYAVSNWIVPESGLVTVTVLGVMLANQNAVSIDHIVQFKENLGVLLISSLFIVLGSRLDIDELFGLGWRGAVFLALLVLVVRPLSVWVSLWRTETTWQERVFVGWLAPRGIVAAAVASVFSLKIATETGAEMQVLVEQSAQLVPITFLVIVGTVAVYGLSAAPLAQRLGLSDDSPQGLLIAGAEDWIQKLGKVLQSAGVPVVLIDTNYRNIAAAKMEGLRAYCASILSEQAQEDADLSGIGRLLAMTANDEVNLLATREFEHLFGKANVYELPRNNQASGARGGVSGKRRARELFGSGLNQRRMSELFHEGYEIKATPLSDEFTYADFVERYGQEASVLFVIDREKKVQVVTASEPIRPQGRQTVVALVPPAERVAARSASSSGVSAEA